MTVARITEDIEEPEPLEESLAPEGVYMTVVRALVNCMDAEEVCSYLEQSYLYAATFRNEFFVRLVRIVASHPDQIAVVRDAVTRFMSTDETNFTPSNRAAMDAAIGRLVRILPAAEQVALAPQFLMHRRKTRRRTGAFMVGNHPEQCPPGMKQVLLDAYARRHDLEVLVPLTRISSDLSDVAPTLLTEFSKLGDSGRCMNEQARVFERLVNADLPLAVALAKHHPTAFVFGVGKARQANALPYVFDILTCAQHRYERANQAQDKLLQRGEAAFKRWRAMLESRRKSAECIRLCIWTFGQLQARDALQELASEYNVRWYEDPDDDVDVDKEAE